MYGAWGRRNKTLVREKDGISQEINVPQISQIFAELYSARSAGGKLLRFVFS